MRQRGWNNIITKYQNCDKSQDIIDEFADII